ncbi:MAG: TlpA disulfide reductase family protein [Acidimicrobiia bacterium]
MLVVAAGLLVAWIVRSDGTVDVAEVGSMAPGFTVEVIDGDEYTLSDDLGRPVVLNFWASWCGPCRTEIPAISAFADANPDVSVIGVAVRDVDESSRQFSAEVGASYPLALGSAEVEAAYPGFGLPYTVIIDASGLITDIYNGIVDVETLEDLVG